MDDASISSPEDLDEPSFRSAGTGSNSAKKEALIVMLLFVGVIGMTAVVISMGEITATPPGGQAMLPGTERDGGIVDLDALRMAETVARAGRTAPAELIGPQIEGLLSEATQDLEGKPEAPVADEAAEETVPNPYDDLFVYDATNPVLGKDGKPVAIPTPRSRVHTIPRSRLPDAPRRGEGGNPGGPSTVAVAGETGAGAGAQPTAAASGGDVLNAKVLMGRAKKKLRAGNPQGALADYQQVLTGNGGHLGARVGSAKAYYEMGRTGDAQATLGKVLASRPTHGKALRMMGNIAKEQGKRGEARKYYQRYVDAHPTSRDAERVRGIINKL